MKQIHSLLGCCLGAYFLTACQPSQTNEPATASPGDSTESSADMAVKTGSVRLRLMTPVSEPRACIFPIQVQNGLDESTSVTMIGFNVTGPGEEARGNMFAPVAEAGGMSEARVIVEGQSCDAFDTLSIPEILCKSGEETCEGKIELIDGGGLRFARTG